MTATLTKTLADLVELRDWLRKLADNAAFGCAWPFASRADAVDAAIRFIEEKTKE